MQFEWSDGMTVCCKPYIAIIGDVKNSRKIPNRNEIQTKLRTVLDELNEKYKNEIASNFMITLGDEFQGLLHSGKFTLDMILTIERKMYPICFRFGIGVGEICTTINRDIPLGADGPAYHMARAMITEIKQSENKNKRTMVHMKIWIENQNDINMLINSTFSLCAAVQSRWTERQREVIYNYLDSMESQRDLAQRMGINQSSINKKLTTSHFYTFQNAMETVTHVLKDIEAYRYV
ncbi:MAG TPA: hypothetical protein DCY74_05795 [Clostridiales bacterium]|jgi:hypothetical protein|nr:hypothetical protein [Clostridiales bacterium]HCG35005.1 hypothetical protein [Clostridiales bacterium]